KEVQPVPHQSKIVLSRAVRPRPEQAGVLLAQIRDIAFTLRLADVEGSQPSRLVPSPAGVRVVVDQYGAVSHQVLRRVVPVVQYGDVGVPPVQRVPPPERELPPHERTGAPPRSRTPAIVRREPDEPRPGGL